MTEPGLAGGDADSQVEGQPGFFGTRSADQQVETGAGNDAFDAPILPGCRVEGFPGRVDAQLVLGWIFDMVKGFFDLELHMNVIGRGSDGLEEGILALIEAAAHQGADRFISGPPIVRYVLGREGSEAEMDKLGKGRGGG